MTKAQAIHEFYSSFGIPAYPSNNVPDDVVFPYLVYENIIGNRGSEVNPTINLWYYTDSETIPNAKADQIAKEIGMGKSLWCDDGAIYVYFGGSWQALSDDNDPAIKRRFANFSIIFNTL